MSDDILPKRDIFSSCKLPTNLDASVWRYMDIPKFKYLLEKKAFYLRRADLLQDKFEGTFSRQEITDMNNWLIKIGYEQVVHTEETDRRKIRQQTYISSWCIAASDFDLMWKAYIRNPPGIAIKSSVRRLQSVCDKAIDCWPLDLTLITYYDQAGGENIISSDRLTRFCYKDNHFHLDNEIRIIHWPNILLPSPDYVDLPVALDDVIVSVVMSPGADDKHMIEIKTMMDKLHLGDIPLEYSRDDRAVAD